MRASSAEESALPKFPEAAGRATAHLAVDFAHNFTSICQKAKHGKTKHHFAFNFVATVVPGPGNQALNPRPIP